MNRLYAFAIAACTVIAGPAVWASSAVAQGIEAFYGHFQGSGISENADSLYFAVSVRDLDVRIAPAGNGGFTLDWATVTREGGDPNAPTAKRKQNSMAFNPTDQPGVYRAAGGDAFGGDPIWWSRVDGLSLYTYMMVIEESGSWQVQKYVRTVSGTGMELVFQRIRDGEDTREVRARLVKIGE